MLAYPSLQELTVALYPVTDDDELKRRVVTSLADRLSEHGAVVIYTSPTASNNKLLRTLNVQIYISINGKYCVKERGVVRFFYSLRHKDESLKIIAAVIKRLAQHNADLRYEIPSLWEYFANYQYHRFYLADAPTVLIEFKDLESFLSPEIGSSLLEGVLQIYGRKEDEISTVFSEETTCQMEEIKHTSLITDIEMPDTIIPDMISEEEALDSEPESLPLPEGIAENQEFGLYEAQGGLEKEAEPALLADIIPKSPPAMKSKRVTNPKAAIAPKKQQNRRGRYSSMFPPNDGPVFQFSHPDAGEIFHARLPGKYPEVSHPYQVSKIETGFVPQTQSTYNALDELKNLVNTVEKKNVK